MFTAGSLKAYRLSPIELDGNELIEEIFSQFTKFYGQPSFAYSLHTHSHQEAFCFDILATHIPRRSDGSDTMIPGYGPGSVDMVVAVSFEGDSLAEHALIPRHRRLYNIDAWLDLWRDPRGRVRGGGWREGRDESADYDISSNDGLGRPRRMGADSARR